MGLYASPEYLRQHGTPSMPEDLLTHKGIVLIASSGELQDWDLRRGQEHWRGLPSAELEAARPICVVRHARAAFVAPTYTCIPRTVCASHAR